MVSELESSGGKNFCWHWKLASNWRTKKKKKKTKLALYSKSIESILSRLQSAKKWDEKSKAKLLPTA